MLWLIPCVGPRSVLRWPETLSTRRSATLWREGVGKRNKMANVELGTNDFFGVVFPLVLADRFFRIYADGVRFNIDVFRWDETAQRATFEVVRGHPLQANIASNPTGIVTFVHEPTGAFTFKFRPKPGISQIFGQVPVQDEIS